jgi:transcriptional regulator with XRE-family HTH domain
MKADRDTFGPRLRLERERKGISLSDIAVATKIKESLFAELERGDISKWPQGIFRRAHLCAYVSAIGLPTQPVLAEFLRLFPSDDADADGVKPAEGGDVPSAQAQVPATVRGITLPAPSAPGLTDRMWIACFDLAAVCLISSIVAAATGNSLWVAAAFVAAAYSAVGAACFARSVGAHVQHRIRGILEDRRVPSQASIPVRDVRLIVSRPERTAPADRSMNQERDVEKRRASA